MCPSKVALPAVFRAAHPSLLRRLQAGPAKSRWLTQREADGGYVPRFFGFCLALGFVRFDGESALPPTAANAHR